VRIRAVAPARDVLGRRAVREIDGKERCAAYAASRAASEAVQRAARDWPDELAAPARIAAVALVRATAECLDHPHATAERRRCVRDAIVIAIGVAGACEVAGALGCAGHVDARCAASRAIAMLGLLLHASTLVDGRCDDTIAR
jgi:hypothetical protein